MAVGARAQFAVTEEAVERMAGELANTASNPDFLRMMQAVHDTAVSERMSVAEDVARVEQITAKGIPTPETFRITTRTFEDTVPLIHAGGSDPGAPSVDFNGQCGSVSYRGAIVTVREKQATLDGASSGAIETEIKHGIEAIGKFVTSAAFQKILADLGGLTEGARPRFIADELLDPVGRAERGLSVPDGMCIQRSAFADGRPTLFCVSKTLPLAYPWHKVTITFDN